jgi:excisionase family DNA binding protein
MKTHVVMTLEEVAAYLKVHSSTVYRLVKRKQLPAIRIGSKFRFRTADIDEWTKSSPSREIAVYSVTRFRTLRIGNPLRLSRAVGCVRHLKTTTLES